MNPGILAWLLSAPLATAAAQSSVWKVTRDGGTVYLGARCHLLRPADHPLPAEFDAAYVAAAVLVLESDLARLRTPEAQAEIVGLGHHGPEGSLQRDLAPAAWKAVEQYCNRQPVPIGAINRMRPWFFSFMVTEVELKKLGIAEAGVDQHFFARALIDQKTILPLETYDQQLSLMQHFGDGMENEIVVHSISEAAELPRIIESVVTAWRAGDLEAMDAGLNARLRRNLPQVFATLVTERTRAWLPQIVGFLETEATELILVDGAHLPGSNGLIAALQSEGCAVEPFRITP
jgi:uncharacterized protein YbaP (TraB family)